MGPGHGMKHLGCLYSLDGLISTSNKLASRAASKSVELIPSKYSNNDCI
jgi:hypothetical protein